MESSLVIFDFDGTITKDDSFLRFIRFVVGDLKFVIGLFNLSPILVLYKLKIVPNYIAKQKVLSYFFKGYKEEYFRSIANEYSLNHIDKIIRPKAIEKIKWHKKHGHKIIIVSASIDCWLRPWCEKNSLELLATQLQIKDGILTGDLLTKNCYGIEKVNRIKELYNPDDFEYIYAYGDSSGDKEMLELADKSFYKPFRV